MSVNMKNARRMKSTRVGPEREQGAVLIFCMVFLFILTMMGVSSLESALLEERMAGNAQDYNSAFQAAESSLQTAENWLLGEIDWPVTSADGSTPVWDSDAMDPNAVDSVRWWEDSSRDLDSWWAGNAIEVNDVEGVANAPHYMIEEFSRVNTGQSIGIGSGQQNRIRVFHRVTSRGTGDSDAAQVKLQSTFVKTYE